MWGGELFIPKIPSYRLTDLAKAIAPDCKIKIVGIRPGEKIHEKMISFSDSLNTVEFKDYFVILPAYREYLQWNVKKFLFNSNSSKGKFCNESFSYTSENNKFLSVAKLRSMINEQVKLKIENS